MLEAFSFFKIPLLGLIFDSSCTISILLFYVYYYNIFQTASSYKCHEYFSVHLIHDPVVFINVKIFKGYILLAANLASPNIFLVKQDNPVYTSYTITK